MMRTFCVAGLCAFLVLGCGDSAPTGPTTGDAGAPKFKPIDTKQAVFWDRQTTESGELIRKLAEEFNAGRPGQLAVKVEHAGGYTEIFKKVSASIQAGELPAMAVAYQNMTAEYAAAGAVVPFDPFLRDPQNGLSKEELDDFVPAVIETNKYPEFGDAMYSFPFCKSVLMMFFNKQVLADAGFAEPPKTWTEFLEQARAIKAKLGKAAYAVNIDCSAIAGMIFSMGGELASGRSTLFDSPASLKTFELLETLANEGLGFQITPGTYDDETALAQDKVAFSIRSSSGRTAMALQMEGRQDKWGMAMIPQDDPANPKTVLFGPNICIFNTTPEQQRAAWDFVKFFTSSPVGVRWAVGTGYVPIRKSAAADPAIQKLWAEWPYNRAAYDCLPYAKSEPNIAGWQEVRSIVETVETAVLAKTKTAKEAVAEIKQKADAALAKQ